MRHIDKPVVTETIDVSAPPERVWPIVADIALPVATSDELQAVRWEDGADGPAVEGRRFVGTNRNEHFGEWETTSTVVACDPPTTFAWDVGELAEPNTRWRFEIEATPSGCRVTEQAQLGYGDSGLHVAITKFPDAEEKIVARRLEQWRGVMRKTLESIKQTAER